MEKKKIKVLPAVIRNKATIEGWLDSIENSTGIFVCKDWKSLLKENNYLVVFKLCAQVAILKNHMS